MTQTNRKRKACIECNREFPGKPFRGRCRACFKKVVTAVGGLPGVGIAHTASKERARQGRRPADPTHFEPGSDGKKEIMRLRAGRGESCFHPDDATGGKASEDRHEWHHTEFDDDDG